MRKEGPAKVDIQIKSDWLLICLTFVAKSPGTRRLYGVFHALYAVSGAV